jgi:hypothetical protein
MVYIMLYTIDIYHGIYHYYPSQGIYHKYKPYHDTMVYTQVYTMVYMMAYTLLCIMVYILVYTTLRLMVYYDIYHGINHGMYHDLTDTTYHLTLPSVTALDRMLAPTAPDRMLQLLHPIAGNSTTEWLVFELTYHRLDCKQVLLHPLCYG